MNKIFKVVIVLLLHILSQPLYAQINTDRVLSIARNALYFEDYVLSIQYFNQVIKSKPWLAEPYFYRAVAKISLDDFKGAEEDCSLCLERNPFLVQAYYARGIARQSMEMYDKAITDYKQGLVLRLEDKPMLTNMAVAYIQKKDFEGAENTFKVLMDAYPKYAMNYMSRGSMYLEKGDTAQALADYNKALELDPYYAPLYGNRAIVYYQQQKWEEALDDLDEAIHLDTRQSGYYINRGLVRYQMNNLRGAMADYDQVIAIDKQNLIARFNRGLLRFQVGDNNRAIEDFDVVIDLEPDNFMAYYNRALLKFETGDYLGSVSDYDVVLNEYENFMPAYFSRSEAKRKLNDNVGADKDYWKAIAIEKNKKQIQADAKQKKQSDAKETADDTAKDENTRELSDKTIDKFNRLVVYDKEEERKRKYQSDVRGRVQDRNVRVDLEPMFVLSYYERSEDVKRSLYYNKMLEDYNGRMLLPRVLRLINKEAPLTEEQVQQHFASINYYSERIAKSPNDVHAYFARAIDFMLVQDFEEAIKDFSRVIELDPTYTLAYFNRAVVRYKQIEYNRAQNQNQPDDLSSISMTMNINTRKRTTKTSSPSIDAMIKDKAQAYEHEQIARDYVLVLKQNPNFVYAYYNIANLRCAQKDFRAAITYYSEAIAREPEFAEAYFNRGLAHLSLGDINNGIADLSKSGELGIVSAYSIIKRMTTR